MAAALAQRAMGVAKEELAKQKPAIEAEVEKRKAELGPKLLEAIQALPADAKAFLEGPTQEMLAAHPEIATDVVLPALAKMNFPGAGVAHKVAQVAGPEHTLWILQLAASLRRMA